MTAIPDACVIGICAVMDRARWAAWDLPAALVPMNYVEQVQRAGGTAVLIPPDPALEREPGRVLDRLDGLLLIGGPDVDPGRYGAAPHPSAEPPVPLRDAVESALFEEAWRRGLPVLGICRGMQVMNVARGGTLRQHLPGEEGRGDEHRRVTGAFAGNEHDVRLETGSRTARAAGEGRAVISHHHQAVDRLGAGLRITGRAADDDLPEALEGEGAGWAVGVQWHPEADPDSPVIAALVEAARAGREGADRGEGGDSSIPAARRGGRG